MSPAARSRRKSEPGNLDRRRMRRLYAAMLQCRTIERTGLEAVEVPALIDLRAADVIVSAHPHPALHVLAGAPPPVKRRARLSESSPRGCDLAAQLSLANGIAFGSRLHGRRTLVTVMARDSAPLQVWRDAFRVAADRKLPILFFLITEDSDLDALLAAAESAGVAGMIVDAADAVAVYRVCQEAQPRARAGDGPAFVGCVLAPAAPAADPLPFLRRYLDQRSYPVGQWHSEITAEHARKARRQTAKTKRTKSPGRNAKPNAPASLPFHVVAVRR